MKEKFETPKIEIIRFSPTDFICLSGDDNDGIWDMQ